MYKIVPNKLKTSKYFWCAVCGVHIDRHGSWVVYISFSICT